MLFLIANKKKLIEQDMGHQISKSLYFWDYIRIQQNSARGDNCGHVPCIEECIWWD